MYGACVDIGRALLLQSRSSRMLSFRESDKNRDKMQLIGDGML